MYGERGGEGDRFGASNGIDANGKPKAERIVCE